MKSIHCDRIMMTLYKNINSIMMKTVGAVVFIRLLLLIAGVEPNPGPTDKLVLMFRYQFLLIEVGTILLRKLFDNRVGNDLMTYLKTYPKCAKTLKVLLDKDIITDDQKKFLPPLDNTPDTSNFDITLLTCLLRNICGLKPLQDLVWQHPANGDLSIEADITRLKNCRNYVVHKGTVYISESDFKLKWSELCQILHRLNKLCGIPNLSEKIDDIDNKAINEQLEQHHNDILKAWHEAESMFEKGMVDIKIGQSELKVGQSELKDELSDLKEGQSELTIGQSELKVGQSGLMDGQSELMDGQAALKYSQSELKDGQSDLKDGQSELKDGQFAIKVALCKIEQSLEDKQLEDNTYDDIKEHLKKSYQTAFRSVCVTPLYSEDNRMNMLTIYTRPEMEHAPYHKSRQREGNYKISSYEQVFCKENTLFRNIFVTGDAGVGKTTFVQFMSLLWSKNTDTGNDEDIQNDAKFMSNFEFVFYIILNETNREDVVSMIIDKYFYTSSKDEFEEKVKIIEQILRTKNCLVILDGLDEWRPDIRGHRNLKLPRKVTSDRCTLLTTCRSYIIEAVPRLTEMDIDHQVKITGFLENEKYVREVIGYMNESEHTNKLADDFFRQMVANKMDEQLHIPLIASQLIIVWFKYEMKKMSKAMIYGSIVELLFERAIDDKINFPSVASPDVQLPESFSKFTYLQKYGSTLEKVCLLSFLLLFDPNFKTDSLVFTKKQLMSEPYNISPGEIDFLCQLGIISKNKVIASFDEKKLSLSFLHMSYLEFLAALFVALFDKTGLLCEALKKIAIDDIFEYENFLLLLSGISPKMTNSFFVTFYMVRKDEFDLLRRKALISDFHNRRTLNTMQILTINCFKEMSVSVSDNSLRFIRLEDFNFRSLDGVTLDCFTVDQCRSIDLKAIFVMNRSNAKCLLAEDYLDEFTGIKGLQYLEIGDAILDNDDREHDDRFNALMLQNQSTLRGFKMENHTLLSQLPLRSLPCLTTIYFRRMSIEHDVLHDLMNYISSNILLENIILRYIICDGDLLEFGCFGDCNLTLNLSDHSKLLTLILHDIYVECSTINTSSLESLSLDEDNTLNMFPKSIDVENSKLKSLCLSFPSIYNRDANADSRDSICQSEVNNVIKAIKSLRYLEDLKLKRSTIPDSVTLQLHPYIVCDEHININLQEVTMSDKCFHEFIDSIINFQSKVRVHMIYCVVRCDNMSHRYLKCGLNSMNDIKQYVKNIPCLRMTQNWVVSGFEFETVK